ncbi:MAG: hypothetical protein QN122_13520 [Armatimonadota bacterium]|nr:hypothetical protein [Armatimonadota bacterium]
MPVVLDNDPGDRVLIYGDDGTTHRALAITSGRLLRQTRHFTAVITLSYQATVGSHAVTERWSYTVPAGRIAYLEALHLWLATSTATDDLTIIVTLQRAGGGEVRLARLDSQAAARTAHLAAYDLALAAGDILRGYTFSVDATPREFNVNAFLREVTL